MVSTTAFNPMAMSFVSTVSVTARHLRNARSDHLVQVQTEPAATIPSNTDTHEFVPAVLTSFASPPDSQVDATSPALPDYTKSTLDPRATAFATRPMASLASAFNPRAARFIPLQQQSRFAASASSNIVPRTANRRSPLAATYDFKASLAIDDEMAGVSEAFEEVGTATSQFFAASPASLQDFLSLDHRLVCSVDRSAAARYLVEARKWLELPLQFGNTTRPAKVDASFDVSQPLQVSGSVECESQELSLYMKRVKLNNIHHINWFGKPIEKKTMTPPAVSLVAILATPKKEYTDLEISLSITVRLHRAFRFVDPVLFVGEPSLLGSSSGSKLQEAVIGSCHKLYNECGSALWDNCEENDDIPVPDTMAQYDSSHVILNGWYDNWGIPTRRDFLLVSGQLAAQYHAERKPEMEEVEVGESKPKEWRVKKLPFVSSFLRQMVHHSEIEEISFVAFESATSVKAVTTSTSVPSSVSASTAQPAAKRWVDTLPSLDDDFGPEDDDAGLVWNVDQSADLAPVPEPLHIPHLITIATSRVLPAATPNGSDDDADVLLSTVVVQDEEASLSLADHTESVPDTPSNSIRNTTEETALDVSDLIDRASPGLVCSTRPYSKTASGPALSEPPVVSIEEDGDIPQFSTLGARQKRDEDIMGPFSKHFTLTEEEKVRKYAWDHNQPPGPEPPGWLSDDEDDIHDSDTEEDGQAVPFAPAQRIFNTSTSPVRSCVPAVRRARNSDGAHPISQKPKGTTHHRSGLRRKETLACLKSSSTQQMAKVNVLEFVEVPKHMMAQLSTKWHVLEHINEGVKKDLFISSECVEGKEAAIEKETVVKESPAQVGGRLTTSTDAAELDHVITLPEEALRVRRILPSSTRSWNVRTAKESRETRDFNNPYLADLTPVYEGVEDEIHSEDASKKCQGVGPEMYVRSVPVDEDTEFESRSHKPVSTAASALFFGDDSDPNTPQDISNPTSPATSCESSVTSEEEDGHSVGAGTFGNAEEAIELVEPTITCNDKVSTYNNLRGKCPLSNDLLQAVDISLNTARAGVDAKLLPTFEVTPLLEPCLPLPTFTRTRASTRHASWASLRNKMRRVSMSLKAEDRSLARLKKATRAVQGIFSHKQNVLR